MSNVSIKLKKTHPDAVLPVANNSQLAVGDTGYDLVAVEDTFIPRGSSEVVPVGLTLADISPGYWVRIEPRSGLGFKHSIQPHLGVIDNGYRGDLGVKLYNFSSGPPSDDHQVKKGDKIAQLVVYPLIQPEFSFSDEITETSRGDKAFGSSDTQADTETTTDNEVNIMNNVDIQQEDVNPWQFTNVDALMKWCKHNRDVVDDDMFRDLLATTQNNRELQKNV
jgi:dUTP pyrophosphatase